MWLRSVQKVQLMSYARKKYQVGSRFRMCGHAKKENIT